MSNVFFCLAILPQAVSTVFKAATGVGGEAAHWPMDVT